MTKEQFKKKWENYWFYYKIHTIVAVVLILVVAVLVKQCADRVEPDMTVMIVSKDVSLTETQLTSLENKLAKYTADVNGDGRKIVLCENYHMNDKENSQMVVALNQKLMAEISASDTSLFVTDDSYYKKFNGKNTFFFKLNKIDTAAPDSYRAKISSLPDFKISGATSDYQNLSLSIRSFGKSSVKSSEDSSIQNSANVLKKLLKNSGLVK